MRANAVVYVLGYIEQPSSPWTVITQIVWSMQALFFLSLSCVSLERTERVNPCVSGVGVAGGGHLQHKSLTTYMRAGHDFCGLVRSSVPVHQART